MCLVFIVNYLKIGMTIPDDSIIISKIKRFPEKLNFHQLLIFNKSGICIYKLNISDSFPIQEEQLISSYFTALMSFTKELVGNRIKALEMGGNLKLVVFDRKNLYYVLLCDSIENISLIKELISCIHKEFLHYVSKNEIRTDLEYISDSILDLTLKDVFDRVLGKIFDTDKEESILNYLKDLRLNDDINGVIFLTDLGHVIYSSLKNPKLRKFLKEVEFRVKICNNSIIKLFYTSKDNELIYSEYIKDKYLIILIFDSKIKFGIAEYYLQKVLRKISLLLENT